MPETATQGAPADAPTTQATYTLGDAARECKVLPETAKVLIREYRIPVLKVGKSRWVLTRGSVASLKEARKANKAIPYDDSAVAV